MDMPTIVGKDDPVLRKVATPVPENLFGSKELAKIIRDMEEALEEEPDGVALAAPQIGISYRIFVIRYDRTEPPPKGGEPERTPEIGVFINPEFIRTSRKKAEVDEGCLSVRNTYGKTKRHERGTVRARTPDGRSFTRGGGGILAQVFEHEIDHLNGILFIDHAYDVVHMRHHHGTGTGDQSARFAFFGTPTFATFVLDELATAGYLPALIITTPDKPAGRGLILTPSPVKIWALAKDIPVLQPEKLDSGFTASLLAARCSLFVVAAYGKILPSSVLSLPEKGSLNIHPSLLPRYRGPSPVESQILADEKDIGVSIILLDKEADHGPLVAQERLDIADWPVSRNALNEIIWKAGGRLLAHALPEWLAGNIEAKEQDGTLATFTKKMEKEDGLLNLSNSGRTNYLKYLAYEGWPGTYFFSEKKIRVKVTEASLSSAGDFVIKKVVPEGKREMAYSAFIKEY